MQSEDEPTPDLKTKRKWSKQVPHMDDAFDQTKTPSERQCSKEKILNEIRMRGWNMKESKGFKYLTSILNGNVSLHNCRVLAQTVEAYMGLQLDREAFRRKSVCVKWFDENYELIRPFVDKHIVISFSD